MLTFISTLPDSHEKFIDGRPKKFLSDMKRRLQRLQENHASVNFIDTAKLPKDQLDEIMAIHTQRQITVEQGGNKRDPVFQDEIKRKTIENLLAYAENQGSSRYFILIVDGKIASFLIGFKHKGTLFIYLIGHGGLFNPYSPTRLLTNYMYSQAIADNSIECVHWGLGNSDYKYKWCDQILKNVNLTMNNSGNRLSCIRLAAQRLFLKTKGFLRYGMLTIKQLARQP
jgi:CelD/BcsL family acetyltransferase involved in cellulose biosynthesis